MDDPEIRGWFKVGAQTYRHHCGALVAKRGRLWNATSAGGATFGGYSTAIQAISSLEERDPCFWSYGDGALVCAPSGLWCKLGFLDTDRRERREGVFVCHLDGENSLAEYVRPVIRKHLFGRAHCAKCLSPMTRLETRALREFDKSGSAQNLYFVCKCGHPVWILYLRLYSDFTRAIGPAATKWRRREKVRVAGGRHSPKEMREILALQDNRCIYCNTEFTDEIRPTEDHLLAVADGGTNWAANIVMACWRCNCRRSDIPFRTYCKLLSQRQNRRILAHLVKRIVAMDDPNVPGCAVASFDEGLAHHDAKHPRFINMRKRSVVARRCAAANQLLPRTRDLLVKEATAKSGRCPGRTDLRQPPASISKGRVRE